MSDKFDTEMMEDIRQHLTQEEKPVEEEAVQEEETQETPQEEETENTLESENQKEDINIDKELSGLPKELVEAVKGFKDPDDRAKAIKLAKEQRAREDRLHLELGNTKKELKNISGLLDSIETNPAETFKALAQRVNFDLNKIVQNPVQQEDELYLTPEELLDRKTKNIEQNSYKLIQEEVNRRESIELLDELLSDSNYNEDFIAENQAEFIQIYNRELTKDGNKNYYTRKARLDAMKNAYSKLERLDPEFETKLRAKILKESEQSKKSKFDEAKRQQKIAKPVSNSNKPLTYDEELRLEVRKFMSGKL